MKHKKIIALTLFWSLFIPLIHAQVSNVRFNHDVVNDKYIITYDLAKENRYNYFDIDIIAEVSGIEVRPSLAALSGEVGLNIKYGSRKRIVWDYLIDIEKIVGDVSFKVQARRPALPPPPSKNLDLAVGAGVATSGVILTTLGGLTLLKKGNVDPDVSQKTEPLIYYQTYCDPASTHFNFALAEIEDENSASFCDAYYTEAQDEYKKGKSLSSIGGVVAVAGLYILLAKPFYKPKMKAYRKKHNLTFHPTLQINRFQWNQSPESIVGMRMTFQFGN